MEADLDRRLGGQLGGQMADRAAADLVCSRRPKGFRPRRSRRGSNRWLAFAVRNVRLAVTGSGVLRGMRMPLRFGVWSSGSMPTTPRLWELTFLIENVAGRPWRSGQDQSGPQRRAVGHGLVGADRGVGRLAGQLLDHLADHRHAGRAADQQHAIEVLPIQPGRLSACTRGEARAVQQVLGGLLELLPGDLRCAK